MSEEQLALGELGGDDFGVKKTRHVEGHCIINGFLITKFKGRVDFLSKRTGATSVGAIWSAVLDFALEQLALFQKKGRILTSADRNVEDGHHSRTDQTGLPVLSLFENASDVATENCSRISIHVSLVDC